MNEKIKFPYPNRKYIKTSELLDKNFSYYRMQKMVEENLIKKINGSTYENLLYSGDDHDFLYVFGYVNEGVICLMSAATYHELSPFRPKKVDVAIRQKSKVNILPKWPKIELYYFSDDRYKTGIDSVLIEGGKFHIYDKEKTVCDLLFYRNKYGLEDSLEVLKNYLKREDRDINKLLSYAEKLRCKNILLKYLEVLL